MATVRTADTEDVPTDRMRLFTLSAAAVYVAGTFPMIRAGIAPYANPTSVLQNQITRRHARTCHDHGLHRLHTTSSRTTAARKPIVRVLDQPRSTPLEIAGNRHTRAALGPSAPTASKRPQDGNIAENPRQRTRRHHTEYRHTEYRHAPEQGPVTGVATAPASKVTVITATWRPTRVAFFTNDFG